MNSTMKKDQIKNLAVFFLETSAQCAWRKGRDVFLNIIPLFLSQDVG